MTTDHANDSRARAKASPVDGAATVPVLFVPEIGLTEIEGEPRARDLDLGERLGFGRPRDIRPLIERHLAELEAYGLARRRGASIVSGKGRVTEIEEFWLNEEQALLVAILSDAPNAPAVRHMLIKTFTAWRRGHIEVGHTGVELTGDNRKVIGGIVKSVVHKEIADLLPAMVEAALAADPRRSVLDYVSVRQLLDEAKALQKGRNRVNRKIGFELRERAAKEGTLLLKCPHSDVWLYPRGFSIVYMADRGRSLVADHNDRVMGQGVIKFPSAKKADDVSPPAPGGAP